MKGAGDRKGKVEGPPPIGAIVSKAVNPFGPEGSGSADPDAPKEEVHHSDNQWAKRRERAVWYAVAGIGLMFASGINAGLGVGGALMVIFGIVEYIRWTLKRPAKDDPWRDPELDQWEEQHYGPEGDGLDDPNEADAPDVGESNPDEAWGVHNKRF